MATKKPLQPYIVIDDLLPADRLAALRDHLKEEPFFFENSFEWKKVWHPLDGQTLVTAPTSWGDTGRSGGSYPTGTPIDHFFEAMAERFADMEPVLGRAADDVRYVASAYLYRAGWGLSWHNDAGPYRGAFAYYIHDEWRGNWGGELMIDPGERLTAPQHGSVDLGYRQGGGFREPSFSASGRGDFVMPLPNRLVVMRQALLHSVNPVSAKAGENMRFSVAGFFL